MKDEGANIHVIKRILSKSIGLAEQKEEALNLLTLDRLTGTDLKDIITSHIVELMKEQEEALTMRFQEELKKATEEIRNEVIQELQRQQEQISAENEKLINWLTKTREEEIAAAVPWWKFWQK